MLLLAGLAFSGCRSVSAVPKGWSGGTIAGDILFIGSMKGELVAANATDGGLLWAVVLESPESSGGGFGCAPASTTVAIYGSPAVDGDLVYVGGYDGKIRAISSSTRLSKEKSLRKDENSSARPIVGSPVVTQGKVYIGSSDGWVYALDTVSLNERWKFKTDDKIWSTPAIDGDMLFIGSFDNKLYALDATVGSKKWEFKTEGAIVATPLVSDNTVYVGSFDRHLYAVDANNGSLKWKFMAENWFWAKPVIHNNIIYAGCLDGKVYALNAESGDKLFEFDLGSPISSSPVLVDNSIIVATEGGVVYALDTVNNQRRQLTNLRERVYASLTAYRGFIYIHTYKDALYEVNAQSGAIKQFDIKS